MAPWTLTSPGKLTRLASETPKVGVSSPGGPEAERGGGGEEVGLTHRWASLSPVGEFWLGLEKVHRITGDRGSRLAVQLQDWEGNAESLQFPVYLGGEDTAYSLQLTAPVASELGATTVAPNGLSLPFSTWDQDHDLRGDKNCAKSLSGEQALCLPILPCTMRSRPPLSASVFPCPAFSAKCRPFSAPLSPNFLCVFGQLTYYPVSPSVSPSLNWV